MVEPEFIFHREWIKKNLIFVLPDSWTTKAMSYCWNLTAEHGGLFLQNPWCTGRLRTMLGTIYLISFDEFCGSEELQAWKWLSSLFLHASHQHICDSFFSITSNQRRDYYDRIQCALMAGSNLPLNHAITVINLLSALVPVPLHNLLPERQRACWENRVGGNQKDEMRDWDRWMCFWWFRRQPPFTEASERVGVFIYIYFLKARKLKRFRDRRKAHILCNFLSFFLIIWKQIFILMQSLMSCK